MTPKIFPITMPKWGIEMQRGTITGWHVKPGSVVTKGDTLLDVETDKIVNAVEAPVSGTLRHIVAEDGATEDVGALIAVLAELSVPDAEVAAFVRDFKPVDASFEPNDDVAPPAPPPPSVSSALPDGETRVSPIARRVAERLGIDISKVKGTGRNGRVSKEDVEAHAAAAGGAAAGGAAADDAAPKRTKMSPMRSAIARRLLESKQGIPHYRVAVDVAFAALIARRAELNQGGAGISVNDLLVRACAVVLMQHPALNAQLLGEEILEFAHADLCIAVATDNGLMTPIIRSAEAKTPAQIASELRDLGLRARAGTLLREEISGGTFTISNLGMFGIDRFDAIINPPQVAILAVGAAADRVVARQGAAVVTKVATLTLSVDHRAVDGAVASRFLAALRSAIESPHSL